MQPENASAGDTRTAHDVWVRYLLPNARARARLFCFPYAGAGSSTFRAWAAELRSDVECIAVQLPGREDRLTDPPFIHLMPLVETLAEVLADYLDQPFLFFGHSMGALIGFELARRLQNQRRAQPACLIVSAHRAPHLPDRWPPIHALPDPLFMDALRRLSGTPEVILQNHELRQLLLPVLRADFAVCETYHFAAAPPLACPIFALGGLQDGQVSHEEMRGWRLHTQGAFRLEMIPGDHFFLHSARSLVVQTVNRALASVMAD